MKTPGLCIRMTKGEIDWIEWALDPMWDYWCTAEGEHERGDDGEGILGEELLPWTEAGRLYLPLRVVVIEDLLYRLEEQAPQVAKTDAISEQQIAARARPALRAGEKIRAALQETGFELAESETCDIGEGETDG